MKQPTSLKRRLKQLLIAYAVLLSLAIVLHGIFINEYAERLVWKSLLQTELDHFVERTHDDPAYRWVDTENLSLFGASKPMPRALQGLSPGVHDEVEFDGGIKVILVSLVDGRRLALVLDIAALEKREKELGTMIAMSAVVLVSLLALLVSWGVGRLVRPVSKLALDIGNLQPDKSGQRIVVSPTASTELVVISDALNSYLARHEQFVQRERAFIDNTSHELRTPIAVIGGATELALAQSGVPAATRNQLLRIERTAQDVEQLIGLLLVLAKEPSRLATISDDFALDQILPEIVEDHRYLTHDKSLILTIEPLPVCTLVAPLIIVQAAIGNLLRNAIENSDSGEIRIRLRADATVVIEDPGHGMSPEEISQIYSRMARGGGREGGGIGLDLIARLCEHLGWDLQIQSDRGRGTITTLAMRGPLPW